MWNRKCPCVALLRLITSSQYAFISFVCPWMSLKINLLKTSLLLFSPPVKTWTNPLLSAPPAVRMLSGLSERLWADWIWFPEGHGWADLKDHDGKVFPKYQDLRAALPIALCFLVIRQLFERWVTFGSLNSRCITLTPRLCFSWVLFSPREFSSSQVSCNPPCVSAWCARQEARLCSSKSCPGGLFLQHIKASDTG